MTTQCGRRWVPVSWRLAGLYGPLADADKGAIMAKIMNPEQFKKMPSGTVFAYGERWCFGDLLVLHEFIEGDGYWGFWALNPIWVEAEA